MDGPEQVYEKGCLRPTYLLCVRRAAMARCILGRYWDYKACVVVAEGHALDSISDTPLNTPTMLSPEAIRAIQVVKDSVERPHWQLCEWLSCLSPNQSKRLRTVRYVDGATSIMDILGGRASTEDVDEFDRRYDRCV